MHKHRVVMYRENIYVWNTLSLVDAYSTIPNFKSTRPEPPDEGTVIEYFSQTREAAWAIQQERIELELVKDPNKNAYAVEVCICADLTDRQYTDYVLRGLYIG